MKMPRFFRTFDILTVLAVCTLLSAAAPPAQKKPMVGSHRFGLSEPLPRTPGAVRIAAYNTLNLFDHVDDPTLQGEFDDINMATPDERLKALADAIHAVNADILGLEEVESLDALKWFRDTYLKDMGYDYVQSIDVGYFRGVECSVLSRFKITETKVWTDEDLTKVKRVGEGWTPVPPDETKLSFQRSPLMVTVQINSDYALTVFVVHHKSGPKFAWHREAEALRINEIITDMENADPSRNIVVMGDFNAAPWDKSVRVYLQNGMIDTFAHRTLEKNNPESHLYKTHESDRVFDYILLNSAADRELVVGSQFVYGTISPPSNYDYRTDTPPQGYASDHYPVVIELRPVDLK
ncbi:MAG TPA: endonuclease/exonuclease/phosphatase family protein [Phycisphaerales bacterium]|nr:endonuclease/exonuclease/phosphatase family protein [Phycisphaerales bacterium]